MKLYFLCLSALTVGALSKIDDVCIVQSGKNRVEGKCQKKGECMKAGLAAFSKSAFTDFPGTVEELACPGEDEEVQCCVEIKCGAHTCRNNVESNPCAEGVYVANFRDRNLCPSSSSGDNVQCCVEKAHTGLKRRSFRFIKGPDFGTTSRNGNGLDMASAEGIWTTFRNNNAPSVDTGSGFSTISPIGVSVPPTTPDTNNIALSGDVSTSAATLGAAPITTGTNTALSGDVSTSSDTLGALPPTWNNNNAVPPTVDTSTDLASVVTPTTNTDLALGGSTSPDSSNFNLAQIDNYSQSAAALSPSGGGSSPDQGLSVGLNRALRPEVTYTNGGGSTFSLGPTTSVPSFLGGSSLNGIQAGVNMNFRKLKRSLADALS